MPTTADDKPTTTSPALCLDPTDDVLVLLDAGAAGSVAVAPGAAPVALREAIPFGHKVARWALATGAPVRKFGQVIGHATRPISEGAWVHVHNIASSRTGRHRPAGT